MDIGEILVWMALRGERDRTNHYCRCNGPDTCHDTALPWGMLKDRGDYPFADAGPAARRADQGRRRTLLQ